MFRLCEKKSCKTNSCLQHRLKKIGIHFSTYWTGPAIIIKDTFILHIQMHLQIESHIFHIIVEQMLRVSWPIYMRAWTSYTRCAIGKHGWCCVRHGKGVIVLMCRSILMSRSGLDIVWGLYCKHLASSLLSKLPMFWIYLRNKRLSKGVVFLFL